MVDLSEMVDQLVEQLELGDRKLISKFELTPNLLTVTFFRQNDDGCKFIDGDGWVATEIRSYSVKTW
jgi:hypothetical protein